MYEDLVRMEEVNNATILHNLRQRFEKGNIYTNIGRILVSINPFKWETSEEFFNDEWVSAFQAATDEPIRCASAWRSSIWSSLSLSLSLSPSLPLSLSLSPSDVQLCAAHETGWLSLFPRVVQDTAPVQHSLRRAQRAHPGAPRAGDHHLR
jgi:hypothetical protein